MLGALAGCPTPGSVEIDSRLRTKSPRIDARSCRAGSLFSASVLSCQSSPVVGWTAQASWIVPASRVTASTAPVERTQRNRSSSGRRVPFRPIVRKSTTVGPTCCGLKSVFGARREPELLPDRSGATSTSWFPSKVMNTGFFPGSSNTRVTVSADRSTSATASAAAQDTKARSADWSTSTSCGSPRTRPVPGCRSSSTPTTSPVSRSRSASAQESRQTTTMRDSGVGSIVSWSHSATETGERGVANGVVTAVELMWTTVEACVLTA